MVSSASDPSQSQGLLTSSAANGFRENEGLQSVHHDAWDAPQVHDPASEGLQSVDHDGRDGPQAVVAPPLFSPDSTYAHYGHSNAEKTEPAVFTDDVASRRQPKRRRLIWAVIIAAVVAIVIAVGVGAGVGLTRKSGDSDKGASDTQSTSVGVGSASSSPSTTDSPTTSPTDSAPKTSGTTGIARFNCNNTSLAISTEGIAYVQDCGVYYRTNENMVAPDSGSWVRNLPLGANGKSLDPVTKYSFKDCIDYCDGYNSNRGTDPACYGVSYYANLTWAFKRWPGNCFLKNGRGKGTSEGEGDPDWEHTASTYKNCLNGGNGCAGDD